MRQFRKWRKVARRWQALQDIKAARGCTFCGDQGPRDPERLVFMRLPGRTDVMPLYAPQRLTWSRLTAALDAHIVVCRSCHQQRRGKLNPGVRFEPCSITSDEVKLYGALFPIEFRYSNRRRWQEHISGAVQVTRAQQRRRRSEKLAQIKESRGCNACGKRRTSRGLYFHHVDATTRQFDPMHSLGYSWPEVCSEIEKCAVLCFQCHQRIGEAATPFPVNSIVALTPSEKEE